MPSIVGGRCLALTTGSALLAFSARRFSRTSAATRKPAVPLESGRLPMPGSSSLASTCSSNGTFRFHFLDFRAAADRLPSSAGSSRPPWRLHIHRARLRPCSCTELRFAWSLGSAAGGRLSALPFVTISATGVPRGLEKSDLQRRLSPIRPIHRVPLERGRLGKTRARDARRVRPPRTVAPRSD
jgi:hypothetical protein